MPLQATSGAASYDAFGGGVAAVPNYIEDVFSTWVASSSGRVVNGLDFLGKGGLVWAKQRNAGGSHLLVDTVRGGGNFLSSNSTSAQVNVPTIIPTFYNDGFDTGSAVGSESFVYWGLREQPKFFDVVTYTGDASGMRQIPHSLTSIPGCIIVKRTNGTTDWHVWHRTFGSNPYLLELNTTSALNTGSDAWGFPTTNMNSTSFSVDNRLNDSGATYVAYLFAHDAGGFGPTGTDNVISCGAFTANGNNTIELGYEPQWVMVRRTNTNGNNWEIYDTMRGMALTSSSVLVSNSSAAEGVGGTIYPTATGFYSSSYGSGNIIYIAIRRGPMKVPTTGTSVFAPVVTTNPSAITTTNFPVDMLIQQGRNVDSNALLIDRLRGTGGLVTQQTSVENGYFGPISGAKFDNMTGIITGWSVGASSYADWAFRRAPGFFDMVCYTGTGVARTVAHNLAAVPELIIVKNRGSVNNWKCYVAPLGNTNNINLDSGGAVSSGPTIWNSTTPTSSVFSVGTSTTTNASAGTYVAYLFATLAGVSKVGSYTGNGSSQTINCGFTGGARFVLIKRTNSAGNWMVVDTARGLVSAGDPTLYLNSTAVEVTGVDWLDPDSSGFIVNQEGTMNANVSSASYIFLAIS